MLKTTNNPVFESLSVIVPIKKLLPIFRLAISSFYFLIDMDKIFRLSWFNLSRNVNLFFFLSMFWSEISFSRLFLAKENYKAFLTFTYSQIAWATFNLKYINILNMGWHQVLCPIWTKKSVGNQD